MANGDTVASGNIKLGVDTTPMEQGLSAAKVQAAEQAQQIQQAVDNATVNRPRNLGPVSEEDQYELALAMQNRAAVEQDRMNDLVREQSVLAAQVAADESAAYQRKLQSMQATERQSRIEQLASAQAQRNLSRMSGSRGLLDGLKDFGAVTALAGRVAGLGALLGTATVGAFKLGRTIRDYVVEELKNGTEKAKEFRDSLDLTDAEGSLKKTKDRIFEITGEMEALETSGFRMRFDRQATELRLKKLEEELAAQKELEESLRRQNNARRQGLEQDNAIKEQREQIKALRLEIDKLNQSTFSRLEVSVEKIGAYVELLARRMGRDA